MTRTLDALAVAPRQASGTIGGTYLAKKIMVDGTLISYKIWDTAGQVFMCGACQS